MFDVSVRVENGYDRKLLIKKPAPVQFWIHLKNQRNAVKAYRRRNSKAPQDIEVNVDDGGASSADLALGSYAVDVRLGQLNKRGKHNGSYTQIASFEFSIDNDTKKIRIENVGSRKAPKASLKIEDYKKNVTVARRLPKGH